MIEMSLLIFFLVNSIILLWATLKYKSGVWKFKTPTETFIAFLIFECSMSFLLLVYFIIFFIGKIKSRVEK